MAGLLRAERASEVPRSASCVLVGRSFFSGRVQTTPKAQLSKVVDTHPTRPRRADPLAVAAGEGDAAARRGRGQ